MLVSECGEFLHGNFGDGLSPGAVFPEHKVMSCGVYTICVSPFWGGENDKSDELDPEYKKVCVSVYLPKSLKITEAGLYQRSFGYGLKAWGKGFVAYLMLNHYSHEDIEEESIDHNGYEGKVKVYKMWPSSKFWVEDKDTCALGAIVYRNPEDSDCVFE
jgi:hypothetical protein